VDVGDRCKCIWAGNGELEPYQAGLLGDDCIVPSIYILNVLHP